MTGSLSDSERKQCDALLKEDAAFKAELEAYQAVWLAADTAKFPGLDRFNAQESWTSFEQMTSDTRPKTVVLRPNYYRAFYRVAAVVLLIVSSLFVYQQFGTQGFEAGITYTNEAEKTVQGLEDGSYVYLSDNSSLEMDQQFNQDDRKLRLDGKAFFVVKPDKDRTFEVVTDHLTATVKGTTFLVRTDDHSATVGVNTGIVEVHVGNQTVTLFAGDQLDFSYNDGGVVSRSNFDPNDLSALKSQVTDYYDTPLKVILEDLRKAKNLHIQAPKDVENQRYTLELSGIPTNQIVETIEVVTNTTASLVGDIYVLK